MTKKELEKKITELQLRIQQLELQQKRIEYVPYHVPIWEWRPEPYYPYSPIVTCRGTTTTTTNIK
jgi:hypothetical protein